MPGICSTGKMPLQQLSAKCNSFKVHWGAEKRGWCFLRAAKPRSLVMSSPTSANGRRRPVRKLFFKHLLSTNTFEGVSCCADDDDGNGDCFEILFSLSIYCKYFLRSISLLQSDGEDELKKRQLMELAIINGTYRDSSSKNSSRKSSNLNWMNALESSTDGSSDAGPFLNNEES